MLYQNKLITLTFLVLFLLALLTLAMIVKKPDLAQAQTANLAPGSMLKLFGGRLTRVQICNNGYLFSVGPPRPAGPLMLALPASRVFRNYTFRPGAWVIGLYSAPKIDLPGGQIPGGDSSGKTPCYLYKKKMGEGDLVVMVGTSK